MGDFSGSDGPGTVHDGKPLADRRPRMVDIDNFDQVLAGMSPRVSLSPTDEAGEPIEIKFSELDDFHPDRLYRDLQLFQGLRELRSRLLKPETFEAAARELRLAAQQHADAAPNADASADQQQAAAEEDTDTLERLLGRDRAQPTSATTARAAGGVERILREVVAPFVQPDPDPLQAVYVASVDEAVAAQLRRILHDPAYQELEATWRSVSWLLSRLETDEQLQVWLWDVGKQTLAADLESAGLDLAASATYRTVVEKSVGTAGGQPWSLLLGNYTFANVDEDMRLLARLGAVASQAGAPLIAAADDSVLGCERLSSDPDPANWQPAAAKAAGRWQALRRSPLAVWLGLVLPRVLLRLPYGEQYEELDGLSFEELPDFQDREAFLWGNAAIACGWLIGAAFTHRGWSLQPGDVLEIDDLPACTFQEDGESRLLPCSEVCLTERAANQILEHGVMPLMSFRTAMRSGVYRFQSLADPAAGLSGRWR